MDAREQDDISAARELFDSDVPAAYAPEDYRPPRLLAKIATAGLLFHGLCLSLAVWVYAVAYHLAGQRLAGEQVSTDLAHRALERAETLPALVLLTTLVSALTYSFWFYRVAKNAQAFNGPLSCSPGMAVGCFFIPIYNLWRPYQVTSEVWRASQADGPRPVLVTTAPGAPGWILVWWLLWTISGILMNFATSDLRSGLSLSPEQMQTTALWTLIGLAMNVISLVLGICVVWGISRRQERAAASMMPAARVVNAG